MHGRLESQVLKMALAELEQEQTYRSQNKLWTLVTIILKFDIEQWEPTVCRRQVVRRAGLGKAVSYS